MKGKQNAAKKRKEPEKPDEHDEQDEPPDEPAAAVAPGARHARRRLLRHRHPVHASLPCPRPVRRAHLCRVPEQPELSRTTSLRETNRASR